MTVAERQADDVGYLGAVYQLPGSATAVTFAVPAEWLGKIVDFAFLDLAASTNVSYVLFGNATVGNTSSLAASVSPTDSAITGAPLAIAPVTASSGSHIQIPSGQKVPVRIPTSCAFISHIEGAATGKLRMTLSTGDGK